MRRGLQPHARGASGSRGENSPLRHAVGSEFIKAGSSSLYILCNLIFQNLVTAVVIASVCLQLISGRAPPCALNPMRWWSLPSLTGQSGCEVRACRQVSGDTSARRSDRLLGCPLTTGVQIRVLSYPLK